MPDPVEDYGIEALTRIVKQACEGDLHARADETAGPLRELSKYINLLIEGCEKKSAARSDADSKLQSLQNRYNKIEEVFPGVLCRFTMHTDGRITVSSLSRSASEYLGISNQEILKDSSALAANLNAKDLSLITASLKQSSRTMTPWHDKVRYKVGDETRRYDCYFNPELQSDGRIVWDGLALDITAGSMAVLKAKQNKDKILAVIHASPIGIATYDRTGQCVVANDALAGIFRISRRDADKQNYLEDTLWTESGLSAAGEEAVRNHTALRLDSVNVQTPAMDVILDCHFVPFGNRGLLFLAQDVTDLKQTAFELRRSEQLLNNVIDQNPYPIWISDTRGICVRINKACCNLLGISVEEAIGKYNVFEDSVLGSQGIHAHFRAVLTEGRTVRFVLRYKTSGQQSQHDNDAEPSEIIAEVLVSPVMGENRQITNAVVINPPITEEIRVREELQRAKAYAEQLVELAKALVIVVDTDGLMQVFNRTAEEITGYSREEVLGGNLFDTIVPRDEYPHAWEIFSNSKEHGIPATFEHPILTKQGTERIILFHSTILYEDDVFTGILTFGIDITEQRKLEAQLTKSQRMEAVGQLAGGIAHDFNNMLSVILGHVELIMSNLDSTDPVLNELAEIEKAGLRSKDIIRQLLAFSRRQVIIPRIVDLNELVRSISNSLLKLIGEQIELDLLIGDVRSRIKFDPAQLDQILVNLAVNARDAMPGGGLLTIETGHRVLDVEYSNRYSDCPPGEYAFLAVSDTGEGMEQEVLSRIFEPFFTTKDVGKGTGLGLATVYGIVRQNDGYLDVESEPGKGTTFYILLPYTSEQAIASEDTEEETLEQQSGRVLLVEDDVLVRRMTASMLQRIGYTVTIAEGPEDALRIIECDTAQVDLLITDVIMPRISGIELHERIKTRQPEIRVLFMSGYSEDVFSRKEAFGDFSDFLQKPFNMRTLQNKVADVMNAAM